MKQRIKTLINGLIAKNAYLRAWYCKQKQKSGPGFFEEVESRASEPLIDNVHLSEPLKNYPLYFIADCNYYGLLYQLLKYAKLPTAPVLHWQHYVFIEHGLVAGNFVNIHHANRSKKIITFSGFRKNIISTKTKKPVYTIGPYIHYAEPILSSKDQAELKDSLGRVLLVVPSHSIGIVGVKFDTEAFCAEIDKRKGDFDTVLVCLYWLDMQRGEYTIYQDRGYKVCTAGHRDDLNFLRRLKSIMLLADMVMTNSVGTHIGYAAFLDKPIYIFRQAIQRILKDGFKINEVLFDPKSEVRKSYDTKNDEIASYFESWQTTLTEKQYQYLNTVFGFDEIKSKEELQTILNSSN